MANTEAKFETDSFLLIHTENSHFDELYKVAGNPLVWEQHPQKDRWIKENFEIFFQEALNNNLGCFSIVDKQKNQFIGSTRFYSQDDSDKSIKLGYTFLSPEYWGSGANGHIKKVLLDYIFDSVEKVYFDIGKDNFRSRKATEKLGALMVKDLGNGKLVYVLYKNDYLLRHA